MSHTIDVGPVWCPTCKREYGNTEAEALREALRIAVEGLDVFAAADTDWVHGYADEVLAAVRELVDLGEKP